MVIKFSSTVPSQLASELVIVDQVGLPRYWSTIWSMLYLNDLATSTKLGQLRRIDSLYKFADVHWGNGELDTAISELNIDLISKILESYFVSLINRPFITNETGKNWTDVFRFVKTMLYRINSVKKAKIEQFQQFEMKIKNIELSYSQLRLKRPRPQDSNRALPSSVVEALYEILDPTASSNPFKRTSTKWRVFVVFILLLHQGLRRGELLVLSTDAINSSFSAKQNRPMHWLSVVTNPYEEDDPRHSCPGIKTASSIRQIPVSQITSDVVAEYVNNYRGKPNHSFLMNSQVRKPLSAESISKYFQLISKKLPKSALKDLQTRTGKSNISAHDLRHTCAVVRLSQLLNQGDSMDEALQKMRAFFGWSRESGMPVRYAKAVFEDRLANVWNNAFDEKVSIIRSMRNQAL